MQFGSALRRNLAKIGAESGHEALIVIGVQGPAVTVIVHAPRMEWKINGLNATILSRFMMASNLFLFARGLHLGLINERDECAMRNPRSKLGVVFSSDDVAQTPIAFGERPVARTLIFVHLHILFTLNFIRVAPSERVATADRFTH